MPAPAGRHGLGHDGEIATPSTDPLMTHSTTTKTTVDKVVDTGSLILTLDNLQDARSQELVSPDVDKWLKE